MKQVRVILRKLSSIKFIRKTHDLFQRVMASVFSASYILSIFYHLLVFVSFMREQRAVLAGKARYYKNLTTAHNASQVALRRKIHGIEKALLMRPRRSVFAKHYILETVERYKRGVEQWEHDKQNYDESELNWAHNVLSEYFEVVDAEGPIALAKDIFFRQNYSPEKRDMCPYLRNKPSNLPSYDQLLALSKYRRSVRWFLPDNVPRKEIDAALLIAQQAPTACNRMPYEFRIFDDPQIVKKIAHMPLGTDGYADNIPVTAVIIGDLSCYYASSDRHAIYIDASLAAMNFSLALETRGVSACMIHWADFEPLERKMQKLLGLAYYERPIMLIAIGYADPEALVAYSQKKSLDFIRSYNRIRDK